MQVYPSIKYIHVAAVGLSLAGFALRNYWRWRAPERLRHPLTRTLPHVNDTLLLASGAGTAWLLGWSPLDHPWLAAKLAALVAYVVIGSAALRGPTPGVRAAAFLGAVTVFAYIVAVALAKGPAPWLLL